MSIARLFGGRSHDFSMTTTVLFVSVLMVFPFSLRSQAQGRFSSGISPPKVCAGLDVITYVGQVTKVEGLATAPDDDIFKYEWDFDGDGHSDFESSVTGKTSFTFTSPGTYEAVLKVYDSQGQIALDVIKVTVKTGEGKQEYVSEVRMRPQAAPPKRIEADGVIKRYAIMINGSPETRFWNDVTFMYSTLIEDYDFTPSDIYLFNYDGTNPYGVNPDNMIDFLAWPPNIDSLFTELSHILNSDDELFVWVSCHGRGYNGPQSKYYGYLDGFASVDPDDEQDYLESEFKLRSLFTGGDYRCNHGMNVWRVYYQAYGSDYRMYRNKFVSHFTNITFEKDGIRSDSDILIERFSDLLKGDTNRNRIIETGQGEVYDYDGDSNPPYNNVTGVFDEDDWVGIYSYEDNFNSNTIIYGVDENQGWIKASFFDADDDNCIDIDIDYDETDFPHNLQSDGEDIDNAGLFDGIDLNGDGDMNDWVSIDEKICLLADDMDDDEMAIFLNRIGANVISIFMQQCFSGGFIDDVSASNRVISTATEEETVSWGNLFVEHFTSAFHWATRSGYPVYADYDGNGFISMMEAFNYAAENDYYDETPQYDDNGDGFGHSYPIPNGGDGNLGAVTFLIDAVFIAIISPQGGEEWIMGSIHDIDWISAGTSGYVKINYSTNDGFNWENIVDSTPDDGSHPWTVPNTPSTNCLVKICDTETIDFCDQSNSPFTITPPCEITLTSPNGEESWCVGENHDITWISQGTCGIVEIIYSINGGVDWDSVTAGGILDTGSYPWFIPNTPSTQCLVRVCDGMNRDCCDRSDSSFTIYLPCEITVTAPNGGESWCAAEIQDITWISQGKSGNVEITYSTNGGSSWQPEIAITSDDGLYSWTIPDTPSLSCLVKICDAGDTDCCDQSDSTFKISECGPLEIVIESLPDGYVGCPYEATLTASGGVLPYSWSVVSGNLPLGMQVDALTGHISGKTNSLETFCCTIEVEDDVGATDTQEFCLTIVGYGGMKGDANGDGVITILDAVKTVNIVLGIIAPTLDQLCGADCNGPIGNCDGDGQVNIMDAIKIVNLILELDECP